MNELILHHYDISNFSEKVRLILGFKELSWSSVCHCRDCQQATGSAYASVIYPPMSGDQL